MKQEIGGICSTLILSLCILSFADGHAANTNGISPVVGENVYHDYGYVAMADGVRLAYVVWRPKQEGRYPTLLYYDSYYAGGLPFSEVKPYLDAGYAVLGVNVRGSGCSEGSYSFTGPLEGPDGARVVEWAASQFWSTGNVGMYGVSNAGVSQLAVAAQHPPHLKAIAPNIMPASLYRDFAATTGGMIHLGAAADWTFKIQPQLADLGIDARVSGGDKVCQEIRTQQPAMTSFYRDVLQHPLQDDWWEARALENIAAQIQVPAMLMETWQDQYDMPDGGLRVFQLLKSKYKKIVLQNGAHGAAQDQSGIIRWLDRWVKGIKNGVEREPPVVVRWEQGGKGATGWTTTYPSWPVPNLERRLFYLTERGQLIHEQPTPEGDQGARTYVYPMGFELVGSNAQFASAPHALGTLNYQTEPMGDDMTLLGSPILTFYFSSEQTDTDFMFTLKDVDAEENVLFLQRAYLRASLRSIDPVRSSGDYVAQSFRQYEKLVPGSIYEVRLSLGALGHVVRKGHRLQLSILAPNPIPSPIMGSVPLGGVSINKVYQSKRYPSVLQLPVVLGEKAQQPPPECGSLPMQPCRRPPPIQHGTD